MLFMSIFTIKASAYSYSDELDSIGIYDIKGTTKWALRIETHGQKYELIAPREVLEEMPSEIVEWIKARIEESR